MYNSKKQWEDKWVNWGSQRLTWSICYLKD